MKTPCYGKSALFDSTDPGDHAEAAKLCHTCPVLEACRAQLHAARRGVSQEPGHGPQGTWAGEPVGKAATRAARVAVEEAMFTDAEARAAALEYKRGIRDDRNRIGARVYERRRIAAQRERKAMRAVA